MNLADQVVRAIIRGAAYRLMREAPVWVCVAILVAALLIGSIR